MFKQSWSYKCVYIANINFILAYNINCRANADWHYSRDLWCFPTFHSECNTRESIRFQYEPGTNRGFKGIRQCSYHRGGSQWFVMILVHSYGTANIGSLCWFVLLVLDSCRKLTVSLLLSNCILVALSLMDATGVGCA